MKEDWRLLVIEDGKVWLDGIRVRVQAKIDDIQEFIGNLDNQRGYIRILERPFRVVGYLKEEKLHG